MLPAWAWVLLEDYVERSLGARGEASRDPRATLEALARLWPDLSCTILVQAPWMGTVRFKRLSTEETELYLDSGEWQGKAGGYAIQGLAATLIPAINGSYSNVVGLPLTETVAMLTGLGWRR